jgi:tetratricopeptide (TPR) repeat protein
MDRMTDPIAAPSSPADADYERGFAAFKAADFRAAIVALSRALELDPGHVPSLRTLAMAYFHVDDFAAALAIGERHVAADPKDVVAHSSLSLFLMKNGRIKEAEEVAARAKVMTWKKQLKEGVPQGLSVLDARPVIESSPMMPLGITPPKPKTDDAKKPTS